MTPSALPEIKEDNSRNSRIGNFENDHLTWYTQAISNDEQEGELYYGDYEKRQAIQTYCT